MNTKKMNLTEIKGHVQHPDYQMEIADIIRSNLTPKLMQKRLQDYHENDIATAMELLKKDERYRLYSILDTETLANVMEYSDHPNDYIGELGIRKRIEVLSQMEVSAAAEYLRQLEKSERNAHLDLMDESVRKEIMLLSSFDEDEIGSKMTTNYIAIRAGISVRQAMRELVDQAAENDNVSTI